VGSDRHSQGEENIELRDPHIKKSVFITVLIILVVTTGCTKYLETGCTIPCNQTDNTTLTGCTCLSTPAPPKENITPFPQRENVTVTATTTTPPAGARSRDPIIGVWRENYSYGYDDRYRFNADGTFIESFSLGPGKKTILIHGTWSAQGSNTYLLRDSKNDTHATFIYDPEQNAIYPLKNTISWLTPYSGDVAAL
jgi:hypothetical protein